MCYVFTSCISVPCIIKRCQINLSLAPSCLFFKTLITCTIKYFLIFNQSIWMIHLFLNSVNEQLPFCALAPSLDSPRPNSRLEGCLVRCVVVELNEPQHWAYRPVTKRERRQTTAAWSRLGMYSSAPCPVSCLPAHTDFFSGSSSSSEVCKASCHIEYQRINPPSPRCLGSA